MVNVSKLCVGEKYPFVSGFVMEAFFLLLAGKKEPPGKQGNGDKSAQQHIGERSDYSSQDQAQDQGSDSPANELALKTPVDKGFLKPLIDGKRFGHQTPKKALITTLTN